MIKASFSFKFIFWLPVVFNPFRFFFFFGRMVMLVLCCHAMMLKLAMIRALTPSKPGNWTNNLLRT
jgi:integral membrane sensor domain MASE1